MNYLQWSLQLFKKGFMLAVYSVGKMVEELSDFYISL